MLVDDKILIGKSGEEEIFIHPQNLNRHGMILGATGTGKTITLKVLAEDLSDLGVVSLIVDIKGDVAALANAGNFDKVASRLQKMEVTNFKNKAYPVVLFDVFAKKGHPFKATLDLIAPDILANMLDLNDTQEAIINIAYKVAKDQKLALKNLDDLKAILNYIQDNASSLSVDYGNIAKSSIATILRAILVLKENGGDLFIAEKALEIHDLFANFNGGQINILECQELFQKPKLYTAFLIYLLDRLYNSLNEVGNPLKPKIVLFFDEAHLIFNNASKSLKDKIIQIVKLIRSKGVGIFFCSQSPKDIDPEVLNQLQTRIQHALYAYSPNEIKAVELAAKSFKENPAFNTAKTIAELKTGEALVSTLDLDGKVTMVKKTMIMPIKSSFNATHNLDEIIKKSHLYGRYEEAYDSLSAAEILADRKKEKEEALLIQKENELKAKEEAKRIKELEKARAKLEEKEAKLNERRIRELEKEELYRKRRAERRRERYLEKATTKALSGGLKAISKVLKNLFK